MLNRSQYNLRMIDEPCELVLVLMFLARDYQHFGGFERTKKAEATLVANLLGSSEISQLDCAIASGV